MRRLRTAVAVSAIALTASLLAARVHPFGDAGLHTARTKQSPVLGLTTAPAEVRAILSAKCADCHSGQTRAPFYDWFAPASWLMERDIIKGREAMNLSRWESYSAAQQQTLAAKIVQETKAYEMPPPQYRLVHWSARITGADIQRLAKWAQATSGNELGSQNEAAVEGDPVRGKEVYEKRCTGCHAMTEDREGPRLMGVYGRAAGTVAGFEYSSALKKTRIVWDDASLEQWLADPDILVPGNNMAFHVVIARERRDLVAFLKRESAKHDRLP